MTPTRARATVVATALLLTTACGGGSDESQPARPDDDATAEASDSEAETDGEPAVADDAASITDGSGGGTITMGEEVYVFTAVSCFPSDGNFSVEGPATNPGPFGDAWVSISADTVEDYDDDGMPDITADVTVEHGKTEMFGDGDDSAPDL